MGKSEGPGNAIYLREDEKEIRKKVMKAKTDSGPERPNQKKPEEIQNLFDIMALVSEASTIEHFNQQYAACSIRYGDLKKQLAEDIIRFTKPLKEKIVDLEGNEELLKRIAREGAEKARVSAKATISGVKELMGLSNIW
jgi:tryptophanyl-tRNA synthetase